MVDLLAFVPGTTHIPVCAARTRRGPDCLAGACIDLIASVSPTHAVAIFGKQKLLAGLDRVLLISSPALFRPTVAPSD